MLSNIHSVLSKQFLWYKNRFACHAGPIVYWAMAHVFPPFSPLRKWMIRIVTVQFSRPLTCGELQRHVFTPKRRQARALSQSWVASRSVILSRYNSPALCSWQFSRPPDREVTPLRLTHGPEVSLAISHCVCGEGDTCSRPIKATESYLYCFKGPLY